MKGELLFHILEHDGFISTSTQRKIHRRKCVSDLMPSALSQRKRRGKFLVYVGICVYSVHVGVRARDFDVICARLKLEITQKKIALKLQSEASL